MRDPRVMALRDRVVFEGSVALREAGGRQALLEVTTTTKGVLRHHTQAVRGAADNPMTDAEVDAKSMGLLAPVLGARRARRLADTVWAIDTLADVAALRGLLQPRRAA